MDPDDDDFDDDDLDATPLEEVDLWYGADDPNWLDNLQHDVGGEG